MEGRFRTESGITTSLAPAVAAKHISTTDGSKLNAVENKMISSLVTLNRSLKLQNKIQIQINIILLILNTNLGKKREKSSDKSKI